MTDPRYIPTADDRAAAAELLARYAELLDAGDLAGVGQLFAAASIVTADGEVRATGADEIAALFGAATRLYDDGTPRTAHTITNVIVDMIGPDELEVRARFTVHQATDQLPLQPIVAGRYVDRLARSGPTGAWAFARRTFFPTAWGDSSHHLLPAIHSTDDHSTTWKLPAVPGNVRAREHDETRAKMGTEEPSNWGRWGTGDERGTANLVTGDSVLRALATARTGTVYELGLDIKRGMPLGGPRADVLHLMAIDGGDFAALDREDWGAADDYVVMATGGTTHIDGLSHMWFDGAMYNGHDFRSVRSSGAGKLGVEHIGGIVCRAHLFDFVGTPPERTDGIIERADVERLLDERSETVAAGDALLFRTGWIDAALRHEEHGRTFPVVGRSVGEFAADHDLVLIGADNVAVEAEPTGTDLPLHRLMLRDLGAYLIELLHLTAAAEAGVTVGTLVVAPLRIVRGVNSPVNPLLIA